MPKTIFKYPLRIEDEQTFAVPVGTRALSVQFQDNSLCLWAMVEADSVHVTAGVSIRGTGHPCDDLDSENYIGTVQQEDIGLVWHVFFYPEV